MTTIPRPEFPRPQFYRGEDKWINLNGQWEFEFDFDSDGVERGMASPDAPFGREITVPFCPESKLSGIEHTDFIPQCWYRRYLPAPADFDPSAERLILHFGAVDYNATVYINGVEVASHIGGYVPFSVDVTDRLGEENVLTVRASSDVRSEFQPSGKQCEALENYGCLYTRTTGIWQTVWMERVPRSYVESAVFLPDVKNEKVNVRVTLAGDDPAGEVIAEIFYKGEKVSAVCAAATGKNAVFEAPIPDPVLWDVGRGELYDVILTFGEDRIQSYFGMRSVEIDGKRVMLNGRPAFMRLVLDQGFYSDGIITAPSDEALRRDVELSMAAGFNGARLHMKVFEPRLIYHADRAGYLLWGEYPNWGLNTGSDRAMEAMLPEWLTEVKRDISSPAIIGWCPTNETPGNRDERLFRMLYEMTHALDPTRPVIDTSGYVHVVTDIYDVHNYEQDVEVFARTFDPDKMAAGDVFVNAPELEKYGGQPYFVSEFGGTAFARDTGKNGSWGYGQAVSGEEEFYARLRGLVKTLVDNPYICGFCYTQLTDVFQEVNGIYAFDRSEKFDGDRIREIFTLPAAMENGN